MHALGFAVRRAHVRVAEVLKPIAERFGLTPARFDVLFVLRRKGGGCDQSTLWKELGVSRATMWKMLRGMEDKGLVWRRIDQDDRRRREVVMTKHGFERFLEAADAVFGTDEVRACFDAMHESGRAFVKRAAKAVTHVARALCDRSLHFYFVHAPDRRSRRAVAALDAQVHIDLERLETHRSRWQLRPPVVASAAGTRHIFEHDDAHDNERERDDVAPWDRTPPGAQ